jgi:hypothetical protein
MGFFSWLLGSRERRKPSPTASPSPTHHRKLARTRVKWREGSFPMEAVGESNYQIALQRICGGHSRYGHELEVDAEIVREPQNPYDKNAVAVKINNLTVGYLPREQAARVSLQMTEDGIEKSICGAKIVGGWRTNQHDEGSFGVRLAIPTWDWIDFGLGKRAPTRPKAAEIGPLKGHYIVIWGAPDYGDEAVELANLGAHIMAGVGKSTTMVVQIDGDLALGMKNSPAYNKTQQKILEGGNFEVISMKTLRDRLK